ncbi:MAG: hypothetical protein R8J94_04990 [Acidimicrobiia bacterium]|nr:hypothetical protein [Acidimicrobiia bacterium]
MIFDRFLPGYFGAAYPDVDFLGIGTTLGMLVPREGPTRTTIVFSSGLGGKTTRAYGQPPEVNSLFEFSCVRGPLTAAALGLPKETAVTDGALLLREILDSVDERNEDVPIFVPHMSTVLAGGRWEEVGAAADIQIVNPCTTDVESVVRSIQTAPLVLAEAMHAAIVADTFGVPWVPIVTNSTINEFKWMDWCQSMGVEYLATRLPPLLGRVESRAVLGAKLPVPGRIPLKIAEQAYASAAEPASFASAVRRLKKAKRSRPFLSLSSTRTAKLDQLLVRLDAIKRKYPL